MNETLHCKGEKALKGFWRALSSRHNETEVDVRGYVAELGSQETPLRILDYPEKFELLRLEERVPNNTPQVNMPNRRANIRNERLNM